MRIQWTTRERELVAMRVMELEAQHPNLSFVRLMEEAQLVLSADRRRRIVSSHAVAWLQDTKVYLYTENQRRQKEKDQEAKPSVVDSIVEKLLQELPDRLVEPLVELLLVKLAERITAQPKEITKEVLVPLPPPQPTPLVCEREKLVKVLVVGTLPQQSRELEHEFNGLMDIRYWKEEGPKTLKALVRSSQCVVLMADKISHSIQNTVKGTLDRGAELLVVSGGVSNLKVALEKYYIEKV